MNYIFSIVFDLVVLFFSPVVCLFQRNNNIFLYTEWDGEPRGESPWVLFKSMANVEKYWITNDKAKHGVNGFVYKYSFDSFRLHLFAGTFVFSHNIRTQFIWPLCMNANKVLIWHGVPLKKIGLQRSYTWSTRLWRLYSKIVRLKLSSINAAFCQSDYEKSIIIQAFNLDGNKIHVTGYPAFLKFNAVTAKSVPKRIGVIDNVIYAPTLRGSLDVFIKLIDDYCEFASEHPNAYNYYLKLHPAQIMPSGYVFPSCVNIYKSANIDYDNFRFVITDYSGVAVEALLCDCDLYIFAPDINTYSSTIGFNELFLKLSNNMLSTMPEIFADMGSEIKYKVRLENRNYYIGQIPKREDVDRIICAIINSSIE